MFSAIGTVAVTATGSSRRAASTVVAITAAAPPMSEVMWSMLAAGLIEMPPVSNVMPLPTSATFFCGAGPTRPAQPDQARLARGALADAGARRRSRPRASAASSSTSTVSPAASASSAARAANVSG